MGKIIEAKMSSSTVEFLLYLIHDKRHVIGKGKRSSELEEILVDAERAPVLFRGVSDGELKKIRSGEPLDHYLSASEQQSVAENFGTPIKIVGAKGFCYWRWLKMHYEALKKSDPGAYRAADGEYMETSAMEEMEWILPFGMAFEETREGFRPKKARKKR